MKYKNLIDDDFTIRYAMVYMKYRKTRFEIFVDYDFPSHWDFTIRIIEKQKNCQMWNSDVPPKPYRWP